MLASTGSIADLPCHHADNLALADNLEKMIETLAEVNLTRFATDPAFTKTRTVCHSVDLDTELVPSLMALSQQTLAPPARLRVRSRARTRTPACRGRGAPAG